MEKKLEKKCNADSLKLNERYSLGEYGFISFVVIKFGNRGKIHVAFEDGSFGLFYKNDWEFFWERPFSSLERELF